MVRALQSGRRLDAGRLGAAPLIFNDFSLIRMRPRFTNLYLCGKILGTELDAEATRYALLDAAICSIASVGLDAVESANKKNGTRKNSN